MNSVTVKVAEQIAAIAPRVEDSVVSVLTDRELKKRSDGLVKALDDLSKLEIDLKKNKPDLVSYDTEGKVVSENFSKAKLEERKKLTDKIGKFEKAINKALENGDFGDVYNIGNQKQGGGERNDTPDTEAPF